MTIGQLLNSNIESILTTFHLAPNGLLVSGEYKGRQVFIKKTEIGYIVTITDPYVQFFSIEARQAIEIIKGELGDGRHLKSKSKENAEKPKEDIQGLKNRRILVVKDQNDERNLLGIMLWKYRVVTASDYAEGLRMARSQYFDLYVLGNRALGGTGLDLCRRIREFDPNTPIIFYSRQPGDYSEALTAGAQAYFAKPIKVQEVLGAVTNLLTVSSQRLLAARRAEYVAIREELAFRFQENCESGAMAWERRQRAERRLMRLKAKVVFLNAGGARGDFARLWPTTYLDAVLDWECAKRNGGH